MAKTLSQVGLNRVIWHLLKTQPDGRFTIPEHAIDEPNPEDAIRIDYDPSVKSFTLSAHKIRAPRPSLIIQPGPN
jgi:hypothetical protein